MPLPNDFLESSPNVSMLSILLEIKEQVGCQGGMLHEVGRETTEIGRTLRDHIEEECGRESKIDAISQRIQPIEEAISRNHIRWGVIQAVSAFVWLIVGAGVTALFPSMIRPILMNIIHSAGMS
jgi:hypothetical protein